MINFHDIVDYKFLSGIKRIPMDFIPKTGHKEYIDIKLFENANTDDLIIEEKIDGKETIIDIDNKITIFCENMYYKHNIPYTVPQWNIVYDIGYFRGGEFIFYDKDKKEDYCQKNGYALIPLIYKGKVTTEQIKELLNLKSKYNPEHKIEGIVLKNYKMGFFGKIVNPEFENDIDEHWLRKTKVKNRINPT